MGPYTTTFPNENGHGTTLGRSFLTPRAPTKILWGPWCQSYHYILEWKGLYIHFDTKSLKNKKSNILATLGNKNDFPKRVPHDRIAKIYRCE